MKMFVLCSFAGAAYDFTQKDGGMLRFVGYLP
jgi:hypothetical protein